MRNRNRGYVKRGPVIDVQIRDEYYVSAAINPTNIDKTEFICKLSIHDTEAGMSIEIDKTITLSSTFKTVNKDVTTKLNELIDIGEFDNNVADIENMLNFLTELLESQKKLIEEN